MTRKLSVLLFVCLGCGVLSLPFVWTKGFDNSVYQRPPPTARDLRFHFEDTPLPQRLLFARLQYFNCIDTRNGIEFALAMGVGNHRDWVFTGRSMVFAKIYFPDGGFEYRVTDYPGRNFSGSRLDSTSRVVNAAGQTMGEIVQQGEEVLQVRGHTGDGFFAWDVSYERARPAGPGCPPNAWTVWDRVPTRGIVPRAEVNYLAVMTRARVRGWLRAGDATYQVEDGNGYADLYWGTPNFAALTWTWIAYQGKQVDAHLYHNLNNNAGSLRVLVGGTTEMIFPRDSYTITFPPRDQWRLHQETGTLVPGEALIEAENPSFKARICWQARKVAFVLMDIPFLNFLIRDALTYEMISDFQVQAWRKEPGGSQPVELVSESGPGFSDWTRRLGWFEPHPARTDGYKTEGRSQAPQR